jgi:hypothetical protein
LRKGRPYFQVLKSKYKDDYEELLLIIPILPGFDSRQYQKKKVVSLERGPLSLVSTTEELLERKIAAPV